VTLPHLSRNMKQHVQVRYACTDTVKEWENRERLCIQI